MPDNKAISKNDSLASIVRDIMDAEMARQDFARGKITGAHYLNYLMEAFNPWSAGLIDSNLVNARSKMFNEYAPAIFPAIKSIPTKRLIDSLSTKYNYPLSYDSTLIGTYSNAKVGSGMMQSYYDSNAGSFNPNKNSITLQTSPSSSAAALTYIHELLHQASPTDRYVKGVKHKDQPIERMAYSLSEYLLDALENYQKPDSNLIRKYGKMRPSLLDSLTTLRPDFPFSQWYNDGLLK